MKSLSEEPQPYKMVIIKASREVFSRFGYRKTTMDDIGRHIGKGKTSLYYYFKSKEEIFEEVLAYEVELLKNELFEALDKEKNPQKKLRTYIITRMKLFHQLVSFYSAIQREFYENMSLIERIRKKYDEQELELISIIIEDGKKQKHFVVKDSKLTAYAIILAMKGFEVPFSEKDSKQIENEIDQLLEVLFYGLLKR